MLKKENILFLLFSIINISIGLFTMYLLSNYFSIEDFGKLQLLLSLIGIFTIFYLSGYDIFIMKYIYNQNDYIVWYVLKKIMLVSLVFLFIFMLVSYLFIDENLDLILLSMLIVSFGLFDKTNAILNSKLKFKQLRYIELFVKLSLLGLLLICIFMSFDIQSYIIYFVVLSIFISIARTIYGFKQLESVANNIDLKKEGIKTAFSTSYTVVASWFDKVLLGFIDVNMLSYFIIGQLFPRVIKDNVKVLLLPTLSTWASEGFNHYKLMIKKYQFFLWAIGILMYIILYILVDIIISNFFIKYEESIFIAQLLSITLIFKFVELSKMSSMSLSKYTYIFNNINNISNTFKILLVAILIPIFGIYGAVSSILITESLRFILITHEFRKL